MWDSRGIFRAACMECGDECTEFEKVDVTPFCGYCGCPATKHKKKNVTEECERPAGDDTKSVEIVTSVNQDKKVITEETQQFNCKEESTDGTEPKVIHIGTVSSYMLEPLIPDLPVYSNIVEESLNNGNIFQDKLWDNFIMQTASHYVNYPIINKSSAYSIIGRKLYHKYPSIEAEGNKPWSKVAKALSRKIRKLRLARKTVDMMNAKNFDGTQGMVIKQKELNKTYVVGEKITKVLWRTQTIMPHKTAGEIAVIQKKLSDEWNKPKPERTIIKFYLKETFNDRTAMLQQQSSFNDILNHYPCFASAEYFIVEFTLLVGKEMMKNISNKLKEFFTKIQKKLEAPKKSGDDLLDAWLAFEKRVSIYQTKAIKSAPIIEVSYEEEEFKKRIKEVPSDKLPCAVVFLKDNSIYDAAILFSGTFLSDSSKGMLGLLTTLMAMCYTMELNYPKEYVQAMGTLGVFVLDHKYYRLGKKATLILSELNEINV